MKNLYSLLLLAFCCAFSTKAEDLPTVDFHENQVTEKVPLVVEGKTWWYYCLEDGWTEDRDLYEFAVTIGSKVTIDGQEWNKVYLRLYYDYQQPQNPWTIFDEDKGLYGYIREENGIVYSLPAIDWDMVSSLPLFDLSSSFNIDDNLDTIIITDFNQHESNFAIGKVNGNYQWWEKWNMKELSRGTVESHGYSYNCMYAEETEFNHSYCFVEGIGAVDDGLRSYATHLFNMPFYALKMCPCNDVALLTYVTDPDNNIIFESKGGEKLWEKLSGVETISADLTDAPTEYFSLQGVRIDNPTKGGLYLVRQGNRVAKILVK